MDLTKITDVIVQDIHYWDTPDYCDAFICSATYNGEPMTDEQLNEINENSDFVYESILKQLY